MGSVWPVLGGEPVDMWTTLRLAHIPTGEQNHKKRTYDVLPKPDNLIRYRQCEEPVGVQGLGSQTAIERFDEGVVGWLARP
jgi:hypothetical protein